jgi:hypothetical protein
MDMAPAMTAAAGFYDDSMIAETAVVTAAAGGYTDSNLPAAETATEKKIIKNADLTIKTQNLTDTYDKLTAKLYELGGSVFSSNTDRGEINASQYAVLTISPEYFDEFLAYADETGNVTQKNISSEDITGSYVDVEIRLENKRRNLEKYYEYLADADNIDSLIMIQNQIDYITAEIESFEAQLQMWNRNLAESRIEVRIIETQDPNAIEIEDVEFSTLSFENMGKLMVNGLKRCADIIATVFQWIIIGVVTLSPVLIAAGVIVTLIIVRHKRKKKTSTTEDIAAQVEKSEKTD